MDTTNNVTCRWSELIPPHTALSFAAIWDPDEGMVTFSGGKLLDADLCEGPSDGPRDVQDGQSQVLTFDRLTLPLPSGARAVTFACEYAQSHALDDGQSVVDPYFRGRAAVRYQEPDSPGSEYSEESAARTVRGERAREDKQKRKQGTLPLQGLGRQIYSVVVSPFERRHTQTTSEDDSSVTDEGFFEEVPWTARTSTSAPVLVNLNLKSTFSMTTTSTTGYVDVDAPSISPSRLYGTPLSEAWSAVQGVEDGSCPNTRRSQSRRLKKPRPKFVPDMPPSPPADPAEVLARTEYNHSTRISQTTVSDVTTQDSARPTLKHQKSVVKAVRQTVDRLTKCRKSVEGMDERWVLVNISHKVTQHLVCAVEPE